MKSYPIQYPYLSLYQDWALSFFFAVEMSRIHVVSCCRWHQADGKEKLNVKLKYLKGLFVKTLNSSCLLLLGCGFFL